MELSCPANWWSYELVKEAITEIPKLIKELEKFSN